MAAADDHHLLSRYRQRERDPEHARIVADALIAGMGRVTVSDSSSATAVDAERLRGLPTIGPGVSGAVKGTRPGDSLPRERRRRL